MATSTYGSTTVHTRMFLAMQEGLNRGAEYLLARSSLN